MAFWFRAAGRLPSIRVVSVADGRLVREIRRADDVVGWSSDGGSLYVLDRGQVWRFEIDSGKRVPVSFSFSPAATRVYLGNARYVRGLGLFRFQAHVEGTGTGLYVAPASTRRARALAAGGYVIRGWGVAEGRRLVLLVSKLLPPQQRKRSNTEDRLRVYFYPPGEMVSSFRLPWKEYTAGLGSLTADGRSAVLPCWEWVGRNRRCRVCLIALSSGAVLREIRTTGPVIVSRLGYRDTCLLMGPTILATLSLGKWELRPLPGGPIGTPCAVAPGTGPEVFVAAAEEAAIWRLDVRTGRRRVIWRP
jgi:hypothetical protein